MAATEALRRRQGGGPAVQKMVLVADAGNPGAAAGYSRGIRPNPSARREGCLRDAQTNEREAY